MITIYEVAKIAGVSPATVSKVINNYPDISEKTRNKVKAILKEVKFLPNSDAQSLSTKKTWTLGIIYFEDSNMGLRHPFFSSVIEGFKKEAEHYGYSLLFGSKNSRLGNNTFLEYFKYKKVDGIAVICSNPINTEVEEIIESEFPVVIIDRVIKNTSAVFSDNVQGCELMMEYLYNLGHRKIAHITGMKQEDNWASNIRKECYINEMKNLKLEIKNGYIEKGDNFSFEGGYNAMKRILELEDIPTAVFADGDKTALGAIEAIQDKGLSVPDDISVAGFDDIELSKYVTPKLTTIRQDGDQIGMSAADILVDQINKKEKLAINKIIPVKLVVRDSCKTI